jgi:RNA polymerase sigma factor (sigma-70 family)
MAASSQVVAHPPVGVPVFALARLSDERLARLVAGGNDRAFTALYGRYHQPLYRYCRSIVHDETDAQDALQSTLASALVALRRSQRSAPVRPWLFRIAHNEAISVLRRRIHGEELSEASGRSAPSAEDQTEDRQRFALLVADLHELPERLRAALVMRELSGLSHEEIAIALDTSVGAAKQTIFEGRRALAELAEGRSMACEVIQRSISDGDGRVMRGRRVRAHLRDCRSCAAFAGAIPARRSELQALVPVLPATASAAMLARLTGSGSGHAAGGSAGALAAGAAGKTVGATIVAKTLVGAAVVATTALGVTGVTGVLAPKHHRPGAVAGHTRTFPAASPSAVTPAVGPAAGARSLSAGPRHAQPAHRNAPGRGRTGNRSGQSAPGKSAVSRTQHHGRGTLATSPSHARGTPTRSHGGGHAGGASAGQHAGGRSAARTINRRPSTSGRRASPGRSGSAGTPHTSGASASHTKAGSTVGTPAQPSQPAQKPPSPPGKSRTH